MRKRGAFKHREQDHIRGLKKRRKNSGRKELDWGKRDF